MENQETTEAVMNEFLKAQQDAVKNVIDKIRKLGIPVIKCDKVIANGCIIHLDDLEKIDKSLIIDGSICAYSIEIFDDEDSEQPDFYNGKERYVHTYIRLGTTETWIYVRDITPAGIFIDLYEEKLNDGYEYDDEESETYSDYFDDDKINRLACIVAKADGFNLLKNRDQRKSFAKSYLKKSGEEIDDYYLGRIAESAANIYEVGILPLNARALQSEGKTESEIAKILGHTKAKIEKSLLIEVSDEYLELLDDQIIPAEES